MIDKTIIIAYDDEGDWMGVYLDGDLVYQGHSISPSMLLSVIGQTHTSATGPFCDETGRLPRSLHSLKGFGG